MKNDEKFKRKKNDNEKKMKEKKKDRKKYRKKNGEKKEKKREKKEKKTLENLKGILFPGNLEVCALLHARMDQAAEKKYLCGWLELVEKFMKLKPRSVANKERIMIVWCGYTALDLFEKKKKTTCRLYLLNYTKDSIEMLSTSAKEQVRVCPSSQGQGEQMACSWKTSRYGAVTLGGARFSGASKCKSKLARKKKKETVTTLKVKTMSILWCSDDDSDWTDEE
ncbi:hypothetical protein RFI_37372, partial [Reticulomyxa filosa]